MPLIDRLTGIPRGPSEARRRVLFSAELSDHDRARPDHPARGTACACPDCSCANEADVGTPAHPICGCCLADCPDVHGTIRPTENGQEPLLAHMSFG